MEVIYTGLRQTPEMIVEAALHEDVDAIGLSILSGAHKTLVPRITELLRQNELGDVPVFLGGIIPEEDVAEMKAAGWPKYLAPAPASRRLAVSFGNIFQRGCNIKCDAP
jgi:methylmalonyl-CoA mutase, C-terminal domain